MAEPPEGILQHLAVDGFEAMVVASSILAIAYGVARAGVRRSGADRADPGAPGGGSLKA